jgi:hypothetical protein
VQGRQCPVCKVKSTSGGFSALTVVNDREVSKIKISLPDVGTVQSGLQAKAQIAQVMDVDNHAVSDGVETNLAEASVTEAMKAEEGESAERSALAEERRRELEMSKLRYMSVERRREIASLDMMGEYGSKVGSNNRARELTADRFLDQASVVLQDDGA